MLEHIRKCGPTFFATWQEVDSLVSSWIDRCFADQVTFFDVFTDVHENICEFRLNFKNTKLGREKLLEFLRRHDPLAELTFSERDYLLVLSFSNEEADWIREEILQSEFPGIQVENILVTWEGLYMICRPYNIGTEDTGKISG